MGGDWKRVSYLGNGIFYIHSCVSCRTVSLPSFNVLRCKLAKVALFIYSIWYWVEYMMSSVISIAYCSYLKTVNNIFILSRNSVWYTHKSRGTKIDHNTTLRYNELLCSWDVENQHFERKECFMMVELRSSMRISHRGRKLWF